MRAIVIDTETTGLDDPVPVEIAWADIDQMGNVKSDCVVRRFNPGRPISWGAMATHHIRDEDVSSEPPPSTFSLPDGTVYLIGHNIDFDWKVLGSPDVKRICTLALARTLWPEMDSHTLGACTYRIRGAQARRDLRGAHSAATDILLAAAVLQAWSSVNSPTDLAHLWLMSEAARVPTHMTFGKHKGLPIEEVPRDYKQWLMRQPDVDPYLMKALRAT
ncbi:MAG: 3'-5' exonuclease [Rhodospirillales bacterium]